LEVWYSLVEVHQRFAFAMLSYLTRTGSKHAPPCLEQAATRNYLRRSAAAENAKHPPDGKREKVGYTERCALDIAFLGSAKAKDRDHTGVLIATPFLHVIRESGAPSAAPS
jgi:hypothetical protein